MSSAAAALLRSTARRSARLPPTPFADRRPLPVAASTSISPPGGASAPPPDDNDAAVLSLPPRYLRDADPANYDRSTRQRNDVLFDPREGRPLSFARGDADARSRRYEIRTRELVGDGGGDAWRVTWADGAVSSFPRAWVEDQAGLWGDCTPLPGAADARGCAPTEARDGEDRAPWSNLTESDVRSPGSDVATTFDDVSLTDGGMDRAIRALYAYGLLLVTGTPTRDGGEGVAALASALGGGGRKTSPDASLVARYRSERGVADADLREGGGPPVTVLPHGTDGPLRTLYGGVWSTSSAGMADGTSTADSAYGTGALPLHTDMTYLRDPPGLQIFTMVQKAIRGGESVFGDGLAAAERLRETDPEAFGVLCETVRRYRCIDEETGWHLEGTGPVISAVDRGEAFGPGRWGPVRAVRHNDLDRMPDLPLSSVLLKGNRVAGDAKVERFYSKLQHAHRKWDDLLGSDEIRLVLDLRPGDTVVVANQRCFHGRHSFTASRERPRIVMGCYVSQDDLDSRFRWAGYRLL